MEIEIRLTGKWCNPTELARCLGNQAYGKLSLIIYHNTVYYAIMTVGFLISLRMLFRTSDLLTLPYLDQ
ncbi:hypothetical protein OUZ56_000220 [Daphnia magna]|uniref:Uncharacterized protein n=1 Tax=Daphnia magna TaxID=35525 RepID=A0ABQ9ZZ16_9CRUS|nr:hypothetical protein OUZ56_000220 [Daphnia magna]